MKSEEQVKARIAEYKELRSFADEQLERAGGGSWVGASYWEQRVRELSQEIWLLEWVMS